MQLQNFNLSTPSYAHSIIGLGSEWDLHNLADFQGIMFDVCADTVKMNWILDYSRSPWAPPENRASAGKLCLLFRNPQFVLIFPRDEKIQLCEDSCLASISKIVPKEINDCKPLQYRMRAEWKEEEPFNLWFLFQGGRSIEIGAEKVELQIER